MISELYIIAYILIFFPTSLLFYLDFLPQVFNHSLSPLPHLMFFPTALLLKEREYYFPFFIFSTLCSSTQPWYDLALFQTWYSSPTDLIKCWGVGNFMHPCEIIYIIFLHEMKKISREKSRSSPYLTNSDSKHLFISLEPIFIAKW